MGTRERAGPRRSHADYVGVKLLPSGRWHAREIQGGDGKALGSFATARDAAIVRDRVLLWMGIEESLNEPEASRALGPLAPDEARRTSRLERRRATASRYFGVTFDPKRKYWIAVVRESGATMTIGHYETETAAAEAHDRVARGLGRKGKDQLNFPRRRLSPSTLEDERPRLRRAVKTKTSSRYDGVSFSPLLWARKWQARYTRDLEQHDLGSWRTEREAAIAYDRVALHFGARPQELNVPRLSLLLGRSTPTQITEQSWAEFKQTTTSRFRGVHWSTKLQLWRASITHEKRRIWLGEYRDEERAAEAYDEAAARLHGSRAKLNFA